MPYQPLLLKPGINRVSTELASEGSYYACDKVRWRDGLPQPIGGWQSQPVTGEILGVCRAKITWRANNGDAYEAFGTTQGLFLNFGDSIYDITPVRQEFVDETDPLSVTSGSNILTIAATAHGALIGDRVVLSGYDLTAAGIDNNDLNTVHTIETVPSAGTVTVMLPSNASSTVSGGGGTGDIAFLITPGADSTLFSNGYGAGPYGADDYGTPRSDTVLSQRARVWSLDLWGEQLVATFRGGTPVKWSPTDDGVDTRASYIPNAPKADLLLVTSPDRHLVLFDTVLPGDTEITRLAVRWCDQEDYTNWTVTATTTAGFQLLSSGSEVLAVRRVARQNLIWTDTVVTSMTYIGPPYTFGFEQLDRIPAIMSRNAAVEGNGTVMWMALGAFYVYDGIPRVLPCPLKDVVFDNYNPNQTDKFFGVTNEAFQEIWWFYCSEASNEIDRYVIFNYEINEWSYGTLSRTAWEDASINDTPRAISADGTIYNHEVGTSADGGNLNAFIETAAIDIGEGDFLMYVRGFVPDARISGTGTMEVTLRGRRYPNSPEITHGPFTVAATTDRVRMRTRVRQIIIRYESDATDLFWQIGKPRLELKQQGKY